MYKKIILIVSILFLTALAGLYFIGSQKNTEYTNTEILTVDTEDSDNDGLLNWEEDLHGTDKMIADTDGDGTLDGEEIRLDRNPTIPGPNDEINIPHIVTDTMTEQEMLEAQKKFYDDFLQERAGEIEEETIQGLLENFDKEEFIIHYSIADLNTYAIASTSEARVYGNEIAGIFAKYGNKNEFPDDEFEIFSAAVETRDDTDIHKLKNISIMYANLTSELKDMRVPFGTAENHLMFVNGYDIFSRTLLAMADFFNDPVRGGGGYQAYLIQSTAIRAAFIHTADYFKKYGILFNDDEIGIVFNHPWLPR